MKKISLLFFLCAILNACSVFDPNPGEKEADIYIHKKEYAEAIHIIEPLAEQGVPWAQLRLGIAYEYGQGKPQDFTAALVWYRKTATKMVELPWGDGVHIISSGDVGYFNQNNDARVAQYLVARLYVEGRGSSIPKNLSEAWLWARYVQQSSGGNDIIFCCENSRLKTKKIAAARIETLLASIESELPSETLEKLKKQSAHWKPH